jgi:PST family polysaccharide transporter
VINLLQAAATICVAWFLSPDDYGIAAIAMTVVLIVGSLSEMQLGEALIQHKSADRSIADTVWTLSILRGVLLAAIVAALARPVTLFYGDQRLLDVMLVLCLQPALSGMINPRRFLQEREMIYRQEFIIALVQKVFSVAVTIILALLLGNYWALVLGALAEAAIGVFVSFLVLPYRPRLSLTRTREIWGFSMWLTMGQFVNTINWQVENLVIGKLLGLGPLGIYRLGSSLAQLPTRELMAPVRKVALSGFASVVNNPKSDAEKQAIRHAYQKAQAFATAFALPVGVGFALISQTLVSALLADDWQPAVMILQALSAVFAFQTLASLVQPLGMAQGQTRLLFVRDVQMLIVRLPIIFGALYLWALPGIVGARVLTGLIAIGVNMVLVRRLIGIGVLEQLRVNIRALLSVVVMAASLWILQQMLDEETDRMRLLLRLFVEIAFGVVVYITCSTVLWRLMRKPEGPEVELLRIFRALKSRLKPS